MVSQVRQINKFSMLRLGLSSDCGTPKFTGFFDGGGSGLPPPAPRGAAHNASEVTPEGIGRGESDCSGNFAQVGRRIRAKQFASLGDPVALQEFGRGASAFFTIGPGEMLLAATDGGGDFGHGDAFGMTSDQNGFDPG